MKLIFGIFFSVVAYSAFVQAQDGFSIPPKPDLSLAPGGVAAKNFPAYQNSVTASEKLTAQTFDFIHGILASGRQHEILRCRVEIRAIKEERKFSTGTQLVEALEIALFTDQFGPRSLKFTFPMGSRLGRRVVNNQTAGPVEEIKIESPEPYENWFQFQHDGTRIVWAEIGSMYNFATCLLKD
jgi:hypothetical protein